MILCFLLIREMRRSVLCPLPPEVQAYSLPWSNHPLIVCTEDAGLFETNGDSVRSYSIYICSFVVQNGGQNESVVQDGGTALLLVEYTRHRLGVSTDDEGSLAGESRMSNKLGLGLKL